MSSSSKECKQPLMTSCSKNVGLQNDPFPAYCESLSLGSGYCEQVYGKVTSAHFRAHPAIPIYELHRPEGFRYSLYDDLRRSPPLQSAFVDGRNARSTCEERFAV